MGGMGGGRRDKRAGEFRDVAMQHEKCDVSAMGGWKGNPSLVEELEQFG